MSHKAISQQIPLYTNALQHNLVKVLTERGPLTRKELVAILNTPRTTIYDNLLKLKKRKFVERFEKHNGKRGRPYIFWQIKS